MYEQFHLKLRPAVFITAAVLAATVSLSAQASSHREAPFITEMPKVDGTDLYMFRSYEPGRENFITIVANYIPFQDPYGGPNFYMLDPEALYEIHIDNNGDAKEDLTFQFRFNNTPVNDGGKQGTHLNIGGKQVAIPLINSGPIATGDASNLNVRETYTAKVIRGPRRASAGESITNVGGPTYLGGGADVFAKPVDYIGTKSIPDYAAYAASHIYTINIPGCNRGRMFVGQREEPFVINVGEIFDLVNLNPLGAVDAEPDDLADKNVTSLILEVPIGCLKIQGEPVIGAWTTASLHKNRALSHPPSFETPAIETGPWVQVSRLGSPLVNEVVIGLKDKDRFNQSAPRYDGQFATYVTNPTLPALIETLFPTAPAPTLFPRTDLVAAFLTGIKTATTGNVNQPKNVVPAEMLRLNTTVLPTPAGSQNNLGVLGGDLAGFPNGRRPGDDVVDAELRVAMGALISAGLYGTPEQAPAGAAPITDGALVNDSFFDAAFPYLRTPLPGSPNGVAD